MPVTLTHQGRGSNAPVFLAVPSYGPVTGPTAFSLFRAGSDYTLALRLGDCHVDDARNALVRDFLATDCTDLVFIDADVGFEPQELQRLLSYDRDIVGGTYPLKQDIEQFPVRLKGGEIRAEADGLVEVEGLPTGFLRIRRNVLERLWNEAPEYVFAGSEDTGPHRLVFERSIVNGVRTSGDYAFCDKAKKAGYRLYVDPELYLSHTGERTWLGSLGHHLKRRAGLTLSGLAKIKAGAESDGDYIELVREWGNDPWSAGPELLKTAVQVARQAKGPILETGSGLTTLAMAAAGATVYSLEHDEAWAQKVLREAQRLGLAVNVLHQPLVQYQAGRWYEVPSIPWEAVDIVVCDGPPRFESNRKILWGVMATRGCNPRCILVDDAVTEGASVPENYRTQIKGQLRKFAVGLRV